MREVLLNIACSSVRVHPSIWRAGLWNEKLNTDHAYKKAMQTSELEFLYEDVPNYSLMLRFIIVFPLWLGLWSVLL